MSAMFSDISYNTIREEIVKNLTNRSDLEKYIINIPKGRTASSVFSRHSRFSLEDMLAFMIMPRTESTTVELSEFAEFTGRKAVCKQTFFMKRLQLSDRIFDEINRIWVNNFYTSESSPDKWKYLYLLAFDGTTVKLPDTRDVAASFPKASNKSGNCGQPLALMEVLKDVLNGIVLDIQIGTISEPERKLAIRSIEALPRDMIDSSLFIFDRGYIGAAWFAWLHKNDIQYIVRLPRKFNKEVDAFFKSDDETADVLIDMSNRTWSDTGREGFLSLGLDPDTAPPVMLHLVKCKLSTGETEVLAVRMRKEIPSCTEAYELYGKRWGVETTIDELKNQLQIEVFSGNSVLSVKQDIKAKIIAYNLGIYLAIGATESLEVQHVDKDVGSVGEACDHLSEIDDGSGGSKVKVNLNIGWYYLKEMIARILLCPTDEIDGILTETLKNLERNIVEYKLDRHLPHVIHSTRSVGKYITFTNYKRAI